MLFKKKLEIREHSAPIYSVDGKENDFCVYTTAGDKFIIRWDLKNGKQDRFAVKIDNTSYHLQLCNDLLFIGSKKGEVYIINTLNNEILSQCKITEASIYSFLCQNDTLLVGTTDGTIHVLNIKTLEEMNRFSYACGKIRDLIFIGDERIGFSAQDGEIRILMSGNYELEHQFHAHPNGVNKLLVFQDKLLSTGKDGCLMQWNWQDEILLNSWPIHKGTIYDMDFVGQYLVTASRDKTIKVWQLESDLKAVERITIVTGGHSYSVNDIHVIDERNFCSVGDDRRLIWWSLD